MSFVTKWPALEGSQSARREGYEDRPRQGRSSCGHESVLGDRVKIYPFFYLIPVHFPSDILQSIQDWVKLVDDELRCGEEERHDEDEEVGHQLLQVHPLPLVREVFPNDVVRRWRVPGGRISKKFSDCNIYQTLQLSGLMATVEWGGLNLGTELNIKFNENDPT